MAIAFGTTTSLQDALFWMNLHLDLLAANDRALSRLRALARVQPWWPDTQVDLQLIESEIDRVMERLRYWEEVVDRIRSARVYSIGPRLADPIG